MIFRDVTATVGRTPMVELGRVAKGLPGRLGATLETRNPCGSVKDRVGVALIQDAESRGVRRPGMTLVEPTGGNTGIGLASVAAIRGYRLILTMPETMSAEGVDAARLSERAPLDQKQWLQAVFFPEGLTLDGSRFGLFAEVSGWKRRVDPSASRIKCGRERS